MRYPTPFTFADVRFFFALNNQGFLRLLLTKSRAYTNHQECEKDATYNKGQLPARVETARNRSVHLSPPSALSVSLSLHPTPHCPTPPSLPGYFSRTTLHMNMPERDARSVRTLHSAFGYAPAYRRTIPMAREVA